MQQNLSGHRDSTAAQKPFPKLARLFTEAVVHRKCPVQTVCIQTKAVTSDETALPGGKMASAASDLKLPAVLKSKYDVGDELARYVS